MDIPIDCIIPNPFQPRKRFDQEELKDLANSIREFGILERLRVRRDPNNDNLFQLVYGERRWRAAQMAGLPSIPCDISEYTDDELTEIGLIENIQRADLDPLEEATSFHHLLEQTDPITYKKKYSIRRIAAKIHKNKSYVEDRLALLLLPDDLKEVLIIHPHAPLRALREAAQLPTAEERAPLVKRLKEGSINTEEVRYIIQEVLAAHKTGKQTAIPEQETFQAALNRARRRIDATERELKKAVSEYQLAPNSKNRDLLLTCLNELTERAQQMRKMLG